MTEPPAAFPVGRSVRVVPGARGNTPRRGTVRMLVWHHKDRCFDYYVRVCDRAVSKRYREEDLVPDALDPSWLTPTVRAIAEGIADTQAFDRLPILADALQDAGCDSDDVLSHCRGPGRHAQKCWVVDLCSGRGDQERAPV